ncbi:MAG: FAD-dependent oxidoreductase [Pseudomonadota bacterium]
MAEANNDKARKTIAVVGAGISGMGAAHFLAAHHDVTLFEAENRLGGHARTIHAGIRGDQPVDTGFIVFNHENYPNLRRLFADLDVPTSKADMSFSVSLNAGEFEYALKRDRPLNGILAQPANVFRPKYLQMLRDILRFNAHARAASADPSLTLEDLIGRLGLGPWMRDRFLVPFVGAIWSAPGSAAVTFPAKTLVQFLDNHGLLTHKEHPQWYSVDGGSAIYVAKLASQIKRNGGTIRTGRAVDRIERKCKGVTLWCHGDEHHFDKVILAVHSDQAARILADPSEIEAAALNAIAFRPNRVVLHSDASLMPRRRACWAAWNHVGATDAGPDDPVSVTYWMNALQTSIPQDDPTFVSLNPTQPIDPALVYDEHVFHHPTYSHSSLNARDQLATLNGQRNTWYCGAWMGHGFHEDGIASALDVVRAITKGT